MPVAVDFDRIAERRARRERKEKLTKVRQQEILDEIEEIAKGAQEWFGSYSS